jgi:hypothetical protein
MKTKNIVSIILIVFVVVAVVLIIKNNLKDSGAEKVAEAKETSKKVESLPIKDGIIVYYFHTTRRCQSCMKAERLARETVEKFFQEQLDSKKIVFLPINTDEPENRHYIEDYKLFSKSLILSMVRDGREVKSKNLTEIWQLIYNDEGFYNYVKAEIESYLKEL